MPVAIDWPESVYAEPETAFKVSLPGGATVGIHEVGIETSESNDGRAAEL